MVNGLASEMIFMCLLIECRHQALPGAISILAAASLPGRLAEVKFVETHRVLVGEDKRSRCASAEMT